MHSVLVSRSLSLVFLIVNTGINSNGLKLIRFDKGSQRVFRYTKSLLIIILSVILEYTLQMLQGNDIVCELYDIIGQV